MSTGHPWLATWILIRCAPDYRGDSFIGDLLEQYEVRGSWWYWRQALGAVRSCSVRQVLTANEAGVPAADYVGDLATAVSLVMFALAQFGAYVGLVFHSTQLLRSLSGITIAATSVAVAFLATVIAAHLVRTRSAAARLGEPQPPPLP